MAAFFTISINEFPHGSSNSSGQIGLPLGWVSKYLFGIGFAVSIPMVALAFAVDDVVAFLRRAPHRILQKLHRPRIEGQGSATPKVKEEFLRPVSRASRRRRRSEATNAMGNDSDFEKMNGRVARVVSPRRSVGHESARERALDMSPEFPAPMRTWSRRTEFSWRLDRLDIRGRASRDTERLGSGIV